MVFIVKEGLLTKSETGVISAMFYMVYAPMQIVGGMLADKWHPEKFLILGYIGAGIANLIIFFNQSYYVMLITWALNALVQFAIWPATFKMITTLVAQSHRSFSMFIVSFANPAGVTLGYVIAAIVPTWQTNFLLSAVTLSVCGLVWVYASFAIKPYIREEEITVEKREETKSPTHVNVTREMIKSGLPLIIFISFIATLFNLGVKGLIPSLIVESYDNVSASLATILNTVVLVASTIGLFVARFLYPHLVKSEVTAALILFSTALPILVFTMLTGSVSYWLVLIAYALVIMLMAGMGLLTTTYISAHFNKWGKGSTSAGILNCAASLGVVFSNLVFTRTADSIGWDGTINLWVALMSVGVLISIITVPIWNRFLRTERAS